MSPFYFRLCTIYSIRVCEGSVCVPLVEFQSLVFIVLSACQTQFDLKNTHIPYQHTQTAILGTFHLWQTHQDWIFKEVLLTLNCAFVCDGGDAMRSDGLCVCVMCVYGYTHGSVFKYRGRSGSTRAWVCMFVPVYE